MQHPKKKKKILDVAKLSSPNFILFYVSMVWFHVILCEI